MILETLNAHAATLEKQWSHDRSQTIGASEIGQCARKTFYVKNEGDATHRAERDPEYHDGWGAKLRGTIMENTFWAPAMKAKYGDKLLFAGDEQRTFVSGFLSATPDGLLIDQPWDLLESLGVEDIGGAGACIMTECKTSDPRTNLTEAKFENVYQTHVQMGLVRELTKWWPNYSLLSYMDASFWDQVTEFVIPFDQSIFDAAKNRATRIMTATNAHDLKPEGWIAGGRECEYCPFTRACGIERRSVPENAKAAVADPQFVSEITDICRSIQLFDKAVDSNTAQMRDMQDALRDRLRSKGVRKIKDVVTWSAVKGRKTYDNAAIKEALEATGVDLEQYSKIGDPSDRLVITLPAPTAPTVC